MFTIDPNRNRARSVTASALLVSVFFAWSVTSAQVRFEDVTAVMGLGGTGSWVDIDDDGWVDLAPRWHNVEGTRFVATGSGGGGEYWADLDNDGHMDFFAYPGGVVSFGEADGSYSGIGLPERPHGVSDGGVLLDFDSDGLVDVWWAGYENWPVVGAYPDGLYRNLGSRRFARPEVAPGPARPTRGVTACDFDNDHDVDVYGSNYRLQPNQLWINDGDGGFTESAGAHGALGGGGHSIGSAWGDIDNDGLFDLFAGNFAHPGQPQSRFLRNLGPESGHRFEDRGPCGVRYQESYASPALGDYDNDGDLDLFFTTVYGGDQVVLYRNDGDWRFTEVTGEAGLGGIRETYHGSWGDYDNDGDLDLTTKDRLYRSSGATGHWLKVRLIGNARGDRPEPGSVNRAAIGAQVRIQLGTRTLTRQVESATGRGNMNEQTLHFGLGSRLDPVDLAITWPDGFLQLVDGVEVDQMLTVGYRDCSIARDLPETYSRRPGETVPVTLTARGLLGATTIIETLPDGWAVADAAGGIAEGNTILFTFVEDVEVTYELLPSGACETAVFTSFISGPEDCVSEIAGASTIECDLTARGGVTFVTEGDALAFWRGSAPVAPGWNGPGFDDGEWENGTLGIGYGDDDDQTVLEDMPGNYVSVFGRVLFDLRELGVLDPSELGRLRLDVRYDDGCLIYLNGVEIKRANVPEGPISETTVALESHEAPSGCKARALAAPARRFIFRSRFSSLVRTSSLSARTTAASTARISRSFRRWPGPSSRFLRRSPRAARRGSCAARSSRRPSGGRRTSTTRRGSGDSSVSVTATGTTERFSMTCRAVTPLCFFARGSIFASSVFSLGTSRASSCVSASMTDSSRTSTVESFTGPTCRRAMSPRRLWRPRRSATRPRSARSPTRPAGAP